MRSSKTINEVTTTFSYNGSLLMAQVQGSGSSQVKQLYSYDASGQLISVNYNGTEYYYLRNGQTDIVGLMDGSGNRVVEYTYDAWGKLISTTGTLATSLGADNPFRYKDYYYDTETGLYYLMTRYYDPEVCRFISADVYMTTGQGVLGGNMWAYCLNNPVLYSDTFGESVTVCILGVTFTLVELLVIGVAVAVVADILINGEEALVIKAAEGAAGAVEAIAQIWQVVETVVTHPFSIGSGITIGSGISVVQSGKKARDAGKNGQHGDNGRAETKAKKQVDKLAEKLKNTKGKTEKGKIKKKIQRINEAAKRARRGENHSQAEKR